MRIFLIGYMCCGKSTAGRKLARKLNLQFIDMDDYFEEKFRISVPDFFIKYGEGLFRKLESKVLLELAGYDDVVISTGGGTSCFNENMKLINNNGISVYLKMSIKSLHSRVLSARKKRPLLSEIKKEELMEYISDQLSEREKYYKKADYTVKGESVDIEEIVQLVDGGQ